MINITKLEIIGDGEREVVHCSDMTYEQDGNTLKVYVTKEHQGELLPLEMELLKINKTDEAE